MDGDVVATTSRIDNKGVAIVKVRFSIAYKLAILLILAAMLPLTLYGAISLWQARTTSKQAVIVGNQRVVARAADQINQYVEGALAILKSVGENIKRADLEEWQRQRVMRNMSLEFKEFREISLFDLEGRLVNTSAVGSARLPKVPLIGEAISVAGGGDEYISDVFITDELTPMIIAAFPLIRLGEVGGIIAAEIDLLHMWRLVGNVRIGERGYLNVVLPSGTIVASGSGELKKLVLQGRAYPDMDLIGGMAGEVDGSPEYGVRDTDDGKLIVSVASLPKPLGWIAVVEQPADEAYALANRMTLQLIVLVAVFIVTICLVGVLGGRWQILRPIQELIRGTKEVSEGNLDYRVPVKRGDEFGMLAGAFNRMTGDLKLANENIRKQERMAMFGRIASGLVHDLKHPVKSIENASHLLERMYDDANYRKTFRRTVDREFEKINAFLSNLHTLTHDIPYHPARLKLKPLLEGVIDTFSEQARQKGIRIELSVDDEELKVNVDKLSITRALSNIVVNGLQAIPDEGELVIRAGSLSDGTGDWIRLEIGDTGCGMPPERLETVFGDFVTTKRKGLGLGLALTKRILDQHSARVEVESEVGKGTTFRLYFPK
jgi:signal transduction histidine kinase